MPLHPPIAPARRQAPRPSPAVAASRKVPWGWLEWTILAQTALPALLFVPGLSRVRVVTRVGVYAISLVAMAAIAMKGRQAGPTDRPASPWLAAVMGWLCLSILNPGLNSPASGLAQILLNLAILAPGFWGAAALTSRKQVGRIMVILLLCNACSCLVGIGQVLRPGTFNPPSIELQAGMEDASGASFVGADGQMIMRPCGLSDSPGFGSAAAGLMAALLGVGWTLQPVSWWKRVIALGLSFVGLVLLYFSQIRVMLLILVGAVFTLMGLLALQREFRKLTLMGAASAVIFLGAVAWVVRVGGEGAMSRYTALMDDDPRNVFDKNRGGFLTHTLTTLLPDYPLGAGLGRWGQMWAYFGDKSVNDRTGVIWAEIQITGWTIDGGLPMIVAYLGALAVAMFDLGRIALNSRDRDLAYWAAVVFALDLGIIVSSLSMPTFVMPLGLQFWVLAAAISAADRRAPSASVPPRRGRRGPPEPPPSPTPRGARITLDAAGIELEAEAEAESEARPGAPTAKAPGRTRQAGRNAATNLVYSMITLGVGLVATPMLVRHLGEERLGATRLVTDLYGWLTLLELGLSGSLGPLLAKALARGDGGRLHHTMAAGTRAYLILTLPVLAIGAALALSGLLDFMIPLRGTDRADLHTAWFIGLIGWTTLAMIPMRALLDAGQLGYRINIMLTIQTVMVQGGSVALAYAGWGITGQMTALAAGTTLLYLAITRDATSCHPGLLRGIWSTRPDAEVRRSIRSLGLPSLILSISGRLAILSDLLVVSSVRKDPKLAWRLFITTRLALMAQAQLQGIGNASWAGLAELNARGERELFNRRLVELSGLVAVLGAAVLAPIFAFNRHFLAILLKGEAPTTPYGDALVGVAAVNAFLIGVLSLWAWCFTGTGRVRRIAGPGIASATLNMALSIGLTATLGLIGPLLGSLIAILTVNLSTMLTRLRQDFGVSIRALLRAVIVPAALGLPYAMALRWASQAYPPRGWLGLAAAMGLSAAAFLLLAGRFLLSPTDRDLWRDRLRNMLGRPR